jgi:hypothetical protein
MVKELFEDTLGELGMHDAVRDQKVTDLVPEQPHQTSSTLLNGTRSIHRRMRILSSFQPYGMRGHNRRTTEHQEGLEGNKTKTSEKELERQR